MYAIILTGGKQYKVAKKKISPRQVLNAIERLIVERNLTVPLTRV